MLTYTSCFKALDWASMSLIMNVLDNYISVNTAQDTHMTLNYNYIKIVFNFYLFNLFFFSAFDKSTPIIPIEASSPKPHLPSLKTCIFNISLSARTLVCVLDSSLGSMV